MKELSKELRKLEKELQVLNSSDSKLLSQRRQNKLTKEDYEFQKIIRKDNDIKEIYETNINQKISKKKEEIKTQKAENKRQEENKPSIIFAIAITFLLIMTIASTFSDITGFVTYSKSNTFTENVTVIFTENTEWLLELENITSFKISGTIYGEGRTKVILQTNGTNLTVMDKITTAKNPNENLITGLVTGANSLKPIEELNETEIIKEKTTINITIEPEENITPKINESIELNTTNTTIINTTIEQETNENINFTKNITAEINELTELLLIKQ